MRAMIFAAGLGTRLQSLTSHCPKAMVKVGGKPLLEHVLDKLYRAGVRDVVVNVHHFPDQIIDFVHSYHYASEMDIRISDERSQLLDTGGGLRKAFPLFLQKDTTSPVLIHNVDILSDVSLSELYASCSGHDAVLLVSQRETARYLLFDDDMKLVGWTNIRTGEVKTPYSSLDISRCQRLAFAGIHVVSSSLNAVMTKWPDVFGITDFYIRECASLDIRGYVQPGLHLLDVGKPDTIAQASSFLEEYHIGQSF